MLYKALRYFAIQYDREKRDNTMYNFIQLLLEIRLDNGYKKPNGA